MKRRLALIGVGPWGRNIVRTLQDHPTGVLVAAVSQNPEASSFLDPNCTVFKTPQELLNAQSKLQLDGVIFALPPDLQASLLPEFIDLKIPLLLEKPIALSIAQARMLLKKTGQNNSAVLVDHIHLFDPAFIELKKHASHSPVHSIKSFAGGNGPFRNTHSPLWDYGPHDISMGISLTGHAPEVLGCIKVLNPDFEKHSWHGNSRGVLRYGEKKGQGFHEFEVGNHFPTRTREFSVKFEDGSQWTYRPLETSKLVVQDSQQTHSNSEPRTVQISDGRTPLRVCLDTFLEGIVTPELTRKSPWGLDLGVAVVDALAQCDQKEAHHSHVIEGALTRIKPMSIEYANDRYLSWLNDPEVTQYIMTRSSTPEELRSFVSRMIGDPSVFFWAILDSKSGQHIGNVKLEPIDFETGHGTFGMIIGDRSFWGKGIATEVTRLICDFALTKIGLNIVYLAVHEKNTAAVRTYQKIGFEIDEKTGHTLHMTLKKETRC